ncbi:hypothetical protein ABT247_27195 [Kitasatospora sp. NPDC001539]|uniref:hypothetical protein n=1 Tax=Kitasatospora sp. NPDC001539 TaxID=3154384 RepID=UPI0033194C17
MGDRALCSTTEHVIVEADQREARSGHVSVLRTLRQAGLGMAALAALSAVLFVLVGPVPGAGLLAAAAAVVLAASCCFAFAGHSPMCAGKKALILVFGWVEYAF